MIDLTWLFIGSLFGLLVISVFSSTKSVREIPSPDESKVYQTDTGCVKFKTTNVHCTSDVVSLNLLASQHK